METINNGGWTFHVRLPNRNNSPSVELNAEHCVKLIDCHLLLGAFLGRVGDDEKRLSFSELRHPID